MNGERKKKPDGSLERLRDIRGRKPVRASKPPKSADPEVLRARAEKAAAQAALSERLRPLYLQATAEYQAVIQEKSHGLADFELEACWQRCRQEIKKSRSYVSFRAVCDSWKVERDAALEQARAKREEKDRQWSDALRRNWESVDKKPQRERQDRIVTESSQKRRQEADSKAALSQKRQREADSEAAMKREILAEESLRRANLERERKKAKLRAEMQARGEIPTDDVVIKEKEEYAKLRRKRQSKPEGDPQ